MSDFFKFILNGDLKLEDLFLILRVLDLLSYLLSLDVHASLVQALSMVQLVRVNLRVELGKLIVHLS